MDDLNSGPRPQAGAEQLAALTFMFDEIEQNMRENDFQREFFDSLYEQFVTREVLSEKQIAALTRLHERVTCDSYRKRF